VQQTLLVLAGNTIALATTGHSFILGKSNTANKVTSLTRTTSGTALSVATKSSANAPFSVNGRGKVANLNADTVDGIDSTTLENKAYIYSLPGESAVTEFTVSFPGLPAGIYQANYTVTTGISAAAPVNCEFQYNNATYTLLTYGSVNSSFSTVSGGGIIDTRTNTLKLRCFTFGGETMSTTTPASQISFTQVNAINAGATVNARHTAAARSGASH
jgi:hypothetical protein